MTSGNPPLIDIVKVTNGLGDYYYRLVRTKHWYRNWFPYGGPVYPEFNVSYASLDAAEDAARGITGRSTQTREVVKSV